MAVLVVAMGCLFFSSFALPITLPLLWLSQHYLYITLFLPVASVQQTLRYGNMIGVLMHVRTLA